MSKDDMKDDMNSGSDLEHEFFEENATDGSEDLQDDSRVPVIDEKMLRSMRPSWQRSPYVALVIVAASLYFMHSLWEDSIFAFRYGILGTKPQNVGDVEDAVKNGTLTHNTYVTVKGIPWIQSTFFVPKRGAIKKGSGPIKGYYRYFILVGSDNSLIVEAYSKRRVLPERYSLEYTGRLMRLDRIPIGRTLRSFYHRNVEGLERDVEFAALPERPVTPEEARRMKHNVSQLGRPRPVFIDSEGKKYAPMSDDVADVKIIYKGDATFSFDSKFTVDSSVTLTSGDATACKATDATSSSAITLVYDPRVVSLPSGTVQAPTSGEMLLKLPIGTRVMAGDSTKEFEPDKEGRLYTFKTQCGKPISQMLRLRLRPYATREGVHRWLTAHNLPFRPIEKNAKPYQDRWSVLVKISDEELQKYLKMPSLRKVCETMGEGKAAVKQCNMAIAAMVVEPRWEFLLKVPFDRIRIMEDKLLIMEARTDFPPLYKEVTESVNLGSKERPVRMAVRILRPKQPSDPYSVPVSWLLSLQFHQPVIVPPDGFLLRTGSNPKSWGVMWTVPAQLVLLLLLLFNVYALIKRLAQRD